MALTNKTHANVVGTKELATQLAASRCSLLYRAYLKEISELSEDKVAALMYAFEGPYEGIASLEVHLMEKYLDKKIRHRNPDYLSELSNTPVRGLRIWNCDGHVIYAPEGFKIVKDNADADLAPTVLELSGMQISNPPTPFNHEDSDDDVYEDASEMIKPHATAKTFKEYMSLAQKVRDAEKTEMEKEDKLVALVMRIINSELTDKLGSSGDYLARQLREKIDEVLASGRAADLLAREMKGKPGASVPLGDHDTRIAAMETYYFKGAEKKQEEEVKKVDERHVAYNEAVDYMPERNNVQRWMEIVTEVSAQYPVLGEPLVPTAPSFSLPTELPRVVARRMPRHKLFPRLEQE